MIFQTLGMPAQVCPDLQTKYLAKIDDCSQSPKERSDKHSVKSSS